jgi:hypothetical protein
MPYAVIMEIQIRFDIVSRRAGKPQLARSANNGWACGGVLPGAEKTVASSFLLTL